MTRIRFRSRSRKVLGRWQSYCTYMFSKVPSCAFSGFWTLTLKLTQHFDLIYNIGKSNWKILRKIIKTAQDSYTITIKKIVRFQERMHLEKFQVQNGRHSSGHYSLKIAHRFQERALKNLKLIFGRISVTSTGLILWNIMKTAQDIYTITIKQIVRLQERMHFEKIQLVQVQNGRQSAIIHFHMAVIW